MRERGDVAREVRARGWVSGDGSGRSISTSNGRREEQRRNSNAQECGRSRDRHGVAHGACRGTVHVIPALTRQGMERGRGAEGGCRRLKVH